VADERSPAVGRPKVGAKKAIGRPQLRPRSRLRSCVMLVCMNVREDDDDDDDDDEELHLLLKRKDDNDDVQKKT